MSTVDRTLLYSSLVLGLLATTVLLTSDLAIAQSGIDWNQPPPGIVFGLKHSTNQKNKVFKWKGNLYDPSSSGSVPPPGFTPPQHGGDLNGKSGEGFYWYETTSQGFQFPSGDLAAWAQRFPPGLVFGLKHSKN